LDKLIIDQSWRRISSVLPYQQVPQTEESPHKFLMHSQSKVDFYYISLVNDNCNCRILHLIAVQAIPAFITLNVPVMKVL
jgi:hypothetical protein